MSDRDYYCSVKFRTLKIDLERKTTYNCDAAKPHPINFEWWANNPGRLFNTEVNVNERQMMLNNQRNPSCEQNCWPAEDRGATSFRIVRKGDQRTCSDIEASLEILDITISSDCNLSCSYCCKEFSSQWRRDILKNGDYKITNGDDRYKKNQFDIVLEKLSQNAKLNTPSTQLLNKELAQIEPNLKTVILTGGEPLLNNSLIEIVKTLKKIPKVLIYTGLGVSLSRFNRILKELTTYDNVTLEISAECTDKFLEFNRYGIKWKDFQKKIDLIKASNIKLGFTCTLTNLNIFGFKEFYELYKAYPLNIRSAYQPLMMSVHVLDEQSKQHILKEIESLPEDIKMQITNSIKAIPTEQERINIKEFLIEFTSRRKDLSLSIFPKSFLDWIGINDVV